MADTPYPWPLYFQDNLTFGRADHPVAICTLWMKQARLAEALAPDSFALLGNLYSRDGLNYLLRNILARPSIRAIVLCGPDLTQSGASFVNLMRGGVDAEHRVAGDAAQIEPEISREAIDDFRANVRLIDLRGVNDPARVRQALAELNGAVPRGAFAEPRVFPRRAPAADEFPAEETGFVIRGERIVQVWVHLVAAVLAFGRRDSTAYTVPQRELLDVVACVQDEDPSDLYLPDWLPLTREQLQAYYPQLLTSERPPDIAYTYGERLFDFGGRDQVAAMVDELRRARYSRRSVAGLWDPTRDAGSSDPPCLNVVQARVRDDRLFLTAYFRSHDIFRAWLTNAFGLRRLQQEIAGRLSDCMLGDLVIVSQSAHIYADSWDAARAIVREREREYHKNPRLVRDPRGSFAVRVEGYQIRVDHYAPEGGLLATFAGSSARTLQRELSFFVSRVDHAIYLGGELAKAELALKHNLPYIQDRDLRMDSFVGKPGDAATAGGTLGL
ncbi:MAG: thymidylate synthase [Chloroflexi bacterium]|nr:thymidylate synthase [Chloroflexota bacterium]